MQDVQNMNVVTLEVSMIKKLAKNNKEVAEDVSIKKAVAWTAIAKYTTAALQLVFAAILSRLLTPEQYGTVAVINVFVVFFHLFCDMGFGTAVIQDKSLTEKQTNDIFSWTFFLGIGLQFFFIGASFPISKVYEDTIYIPLGCILSFSLFFSALNMIPNAVMLKQKRFKTITIRTVVSHIVTSLITIYLAIKGFGVYALVLQNLLSNLMIFAWNELTVRLRFTFKPDFSVIKRIWGYSIYQFLALLLNYFNRNLDNLLIGKFYSKADLGQYNKSYSLMHMPIAYIPGVVGPALHPILSEHQNDPKYIYKAYLRILKILSLIGCFVSVFLFYAGEELVILLFGEQWHPAVLPFKILALSVWFQLATNTIGPIYQSIGNTKLLFKSVAASCVIIVSSIITGCILGSIVHVAACVSGAYFLNYFVSYFIMVKFGFHESMKEFLKTFYHEIIFFFVLMAVTLIPIGFDNLLVSFIIKSSIIVFVYFIMLVVTKQHKLFLNLVQRN